ncbi:hypothetical protein Tco_0879865 [Tanacetum coccineum]
MKENTSKSKNSDPILELWIRIEAYKKKLEHINVPWENILFNYCSSEFDTLEPERVKENRASEFQYKKLSKRAFDVHAEPQFIESNKEVRSLYEGASVFN